MRKLTARSIPNAHPRESSSDTVLAVEAAIEKTETDPLRRVCISRLVRAVEEMPVAALVEIGKTTSGVTALYHCIIQPEFTDELEREDPLAEARLRGKEIGDALLAEEGGCATITEVAKLLRMSKQGVNRRRQNNRLIAIDRGRKGFAFPRWQFSEDGKHGVLDGLEDVLRILKQQGIFGWGVLSFILNPTVDLNGKTPLQAMRDGQLEDVILAASAHGEMGR